MSTVRPVPERSHAKTSVDLRFPVQWSRQACKHILGSQRGALALTGGVKKVSAQLGALSNSVESGYQCPGKATTLVEDDFHRNGWMW